MRDYWISNAARTSVETWARSISHAPTSPSSARSAPLLPDLAETVQEIDFLVLDVQINVGIPAPFTTYADLQGTRILRWGG
jgi:hypothetical protein